MSSTAAAAGPRVIIIRDIQDIRPPLAECPHGSRPRPAERRARAARGADGRIARATLSTDGLLKRGAFDCRLVQVRDLLNRIPDGSDGDSANQEEAEPASFSEPCPRPDPGSLAREQGDRCMLKHLRHRRSRRMSATSEESEAINVAGRRLRITAPMTTTGRWNRAKAIRVPEDMPTWWRNVLDYPVMSEESEDENDYPLSPADSEDEGEQPHDLHGPIQNLGTNAASRTTRGSLWNRARAIRGPEAMPASRSAIAWNRIGTIGGQEDMFLWWRNVRDYPVMSEESEDENDYPLSPDDSGTRSEQVHHRRPRPIQNLSTNGGAFFQGPASSSLRNRANTIRGPEDMPTWWRNLKDGSP